MKDITIIGGGLMGSSALGQQSLLDDIKNLAN